MFASSVPENTGPKHPRPCLPAGTLFISQWFCFLSVDLAPAESGSILKTSPTLANSGKNENNLPLSALNHSR